MCMCKLRVRARDMYSLPPHSYNFFAFSLPRVDYACIPQPSCEIPLQESLIPEEVSRGGSFFGSFRSVNKSFQGGKSAAESKDDADLEKALQALGQTVTPDDDETKGEPQRRPIQRRNTTDHRHTSANSQGSSAKHWLGEAVKVSVHHYIGVLFARSGRGIRECGGWSVFMIGGGHDMSSIMCV